MKNYHHSFLLAIFSFCFIQSINCQIKAITETGLEVLLNDDGTWIYSDQNEEVEISTPVNPNPFFKDKNSTFQVKSTKCKMGIWIDPKKWTFEKANGDNEDSEYKFYNKKDEIYGMLISEKIEIPIESLKKIAIDNGRAAAPDLKIVKEEYRMVNDLKVLNLQMDGTIQGIKFSYYGYYFSNESGTVQFITYTSQNIMKSMIPACEILLNGLVVVND